MSLPSPSAGPIPPWLELPREITAAILHRLGPIEILTTAQNVCKHWRSVCHDPSMWRSIEIRSCGSSWESPIYLEEMCFRAVDRSQGQLTDISLRNFGSDSVLFYISKRSSKLKSLRLITPDLISDVAMIDAVQNFPLLEELHLYDTSTEADAIKAIGRSCPLLKSFKLNYHYMNFTLACDCDLEARAIAETMPELRHLQLYGNEMTNEGLQAILDGCPHLESLDLRRCKNVHLGGDLGRLCSDRIKDFRHPNDSTDDYEFGAGIFYYGTSDDDYITGYSDVDMASDYEGYLEFSGGSPSGHGSYDDEGDDDDDYGDYGFFD